MLLESARGQRAGVEADVAVGSHAFGSQLPGVASYLKFSQF
jgi:hypothetical protein